MQDMSLNKEEIRKMLKAQISVNDHVIGASVGSGMTAKYAEIGGADFLLALSAGKYRIHGRSSYASYFCYANSNDVVMEMGVRELLPIVKNIPVIFGLFASDPEIHIYEYLKQIKDNGFAGIVNYPTVSLIDGQFREAIEEEGNTFQAEAEAIRLANYLGLFTVAFVTNEQEARTMLEVGADVICVHLGLTKGGYLGARKSLTLYEALHQSENIFKICKEEYPETIRMIYSGPANTPVDMQYIYHNSSCQGYIGGSTFDRIPCEKAIYHAVTSFKGTLTDDGTKESRYFGNQLNSRNYTNYIKQYIDDHFAKEIQLGDIAYVIHVSPSYLSTKFKKETGMSFTDYLLTFRLNKAKEFLKDSSYNCREAAEAVGYYDYAQFSKVFKKRVGMTPADYRAKHKSEKQI